jgi:iron complex outermembrane recepter protein
MCNPYRCGRSAVLALALSGVAAGAGAQVVPTSPDLRRATLEDLMKIPITSASRKEQNADEVPAAVFVLTQDDIRRSGMRTLPELFRLVPGVQVAQINASDWAVSIRGFNDQFANKLLVLIDGRSIYKRNTSGVFWDAEDLLLDDIDRIEVVRGPGGAVWGANAVNGVINIVTKSAHDTQGALVRVGSGTADRLQTTARYGGSFGNAAYRVYSQWSDHGETRLADGTGAADKGNDLTTGLRVDWSRGADAWMVDGTVRTGDAHPLWRFVADPTPGVAPETDRPAWHRNGNVLGRWTHRTDDGSALQVQSVVAISRRSDNVTENENTFDTDLQYHTRVSARQDVVVGGAYRFVDNTTSESFSFALTPAASRTTVVSVFGQDEIAVTPRVHLTLGSKVEHDSYAAWGAEPTVRLMWQPARRHRVWFSASRALRIPSNTDLASRVNVAVIPGPRGPVVIGILGNPRYKAEAFQDVEAGYRLELGSKASVDATAFRGRYTGLPTHEPLAPEFEATPGPPHVFIASRLENGLRADTAGLEIAARLAPIPAWQMNASYSTFHLTPHPDAASVDPDAAAFDGNAPAHQWQFGSNVWVGGRTEVNATLSHAGSLGGLGVPAYTRADARVEVRLTRQLSAIAAGRNLLDPAHVEFVAAAMVSTFVPRSADVQLVWKF